MNNATIVTLEPNEEVTGVSFEEAFGEHSELRGRGRARRQARRMDRIRKRGERKKLKQELRQERKDTRRSRRMARKAMGQEQEPAQDPSMDMDVNLNAPQEEQSYEPQQQSYSQPSYDSAPAYDDSQTADYPLGSNEEVSDDETTFDAESSGEESSFDAENSNSPASRFSVEQRIAWNVKKIEVLQAKADKITQDLRSNIPSNRRAALARELKEISAKISAAKHRIEDLKSGKVRFDSARKGKGNGRGLSKATPVQSNLDPKFSEQKIVVPASGFDGEDSSSFDAKESFKKHKPIIIGLGVAAIAIFAMHKMGVFKK